MYYNHDVDVGAPPRAVLPPPPPPHAMQHHYDAYRSHQPPYAHHNVPVHPPYAYKPPPPPPGHHDAEAMYYQQHRYPHTSPHQHPPHQSAHQHAAYEYRPVMHPSELMHGGGADPYRQHAHPTHHISPIDQRPTYVGYIKSAHDAILLLSACDLPDAPHQESARTNKSVPPPRRVSRRLLDAERADMVASGCVFAWDEKEAGMKRWTDGRVWSASRVSGCFLTYRELEARKKSNGNALDGPTSNQYKPEGLIKQSFSVTTTSGRKLHVISYFTKRDVREGRLRRVSEDPRFVGEGGGEWDLKVDEMEYSFPDGHHRSALPGGSGSGSHADSSSAIDDDDDDDEEEAKTTASAESAVKAEKQLVPPTLQHNPRKRSLPDESDFDRAAAQPVRRPAPRPTLSRLRSSSLYNSTSSGGSALTISSYNNSSTSVATTVSHPLVSPTLPRESAIRGSACDMQATQSQDNANAVGALLSLAGRQSSSAVAAAAASKLPDRRELDQNALNKFSVRL